MYYYDNGYDPDTDCSPSRPPEFVSVPERSLCEGGIFLAKASGTFSVLAGLPRSEYDWYSRSPARDFNMTPTLTKIELLFSITLFQSGLASNCRIFMDVKETGTWRCDMSFEVYWDSEDINSLESEEALQEEYAVNYLALGRPLSLLAPICPFEYQLRTLENGDAAFYFAPNVYAVDEERSVVISHRNLGNTEDIQQFYQPIRGGIIAEFPKIIFMICTNYLCPPKPLPDKDTFDDKGNFDEDDDDAQPVKKRILSKATLILAPNNIVSQLTKEFEKCLGRTVKTINLYGKRVYESTSIEDIMNAKIIVATYNFLKNPCYCKRLITADKFENRIEVLSSEQYEVEGGYSLSWFHFHRIVFDEFHEIPDRHKIIQNQIQLLSAEHMWALTGTPRLENLKAVLNCAIFLKLDPSNLWRNLEYEAIRFIKNRVLRNEPNIAFPDPIHETIIVSQTPQEFSFYRSHVTSYSPRVQSSRAANIGRLTKEISQSIQGITPLQQELAVGRGNAEELTNRLRRAQDQLE
ncbi:DNA helicase rad5 [Nowakowskiella sp. JEL0407]|nr:DNA helicase rad5 [Nowakowskiella sp. JEL0407]